jgi:hypothetical protein
MPCIYSVYYELNEGGCKNPQKNSDELRGFTQVALTVDEVYRVKYFYEQDGNQAVMIANFMLKAFAAGTDETYLAAAIAQTHGTLFLLPLLHESAFLTKVEVAETFGGLDYGVYDIAQQGEDIGEPMPPFVTIAVRQNVGTRLVRAGQKRLPFISESRNVNQAPDIPIGVLSELRVCLGTQHEVDFADINNDIFSYTLQPYVVGVSWNPNLVPPQYVLDPLKQVEVRSADVIAISTQNSRKT